MQVRRGLYVQGWLSSQVLTSRGGLLHHVYLYHGRAAGLAFLDALQRFTTCASLYRYNHSVGLDDCLLPGRVREAAYRIMMERADAALLPGPKVALASVPYRMDEREQVLNRLIAARSPSERYVVDRVLQVPKKRAAAVSDMNAANRIAILSMLGTKGSVSNLVQCTHSLGQQIIQDSRVPVGDFGRVFPHDRRDTNDAIAQGFLWKESFMPGPPPTGRGRPTSGLSPQARRLPVQHKRLHVQRSLSMPSLGVKHWLRALPARHRVATRCDWE